MKHFISRRSFLQVVGISVLNIGLSACGGNSSEVGNSTASISSEVDAKNSSSDFEGFALADAQEYSEQSDCPYFVKKSNGKFYPMVICLKAFLSGNMSPRAVFLDEYCLSFGEEFKSLSVRPSEGDEVVLISNSISVGTSIDLIPTLQVGWTIPFGFEFSSIDYTYLYCINTFYGVGDFRLFSQYDPSGPDTFSVTVSNNAKVNSFSLEELIKQKSKYPVYAHTLNNGTVKDGEEIFIEFNPDEKITLEYYEGTVYHSVELTANTKFVRFTPADKTPYAIELIKDGYAKVNVDDIGKGIYLIKHPYYSIYTCFEIL